VKAKPAAQGVVAARHAEAETADECGTKRMGVRTCTSRDEQQPDSAPNSADGCARRAADSCSGMTWGRCGPGRRRTGSTPGRSANQRH
jgi:hypothetical protein